MICLIIKLGVIYKNTLYQLIIRFAVKNVGLKFHLDILNVEKFKLMYFIYLIYFPTGLELFCLLIHRANFLPEE